VRPILYSVVRSDADSGQDRDDDDHDEKLNDGEAALMASDGVVLPGLFCGASMKLCHMY